MVALTKCEEIAKKTSNSFASDEDWSAPEKLLSLEAGQFGQKITSTLDKYLKQYEKDTKYYVDNVRIEKGGFLHQDLLKKIKPTHRSFLLTLKEQALKEFKVKFDKGKFDKVDLMKSEILSKFEKAIQDASPEPTLDTSVIRVEFKRDIDDHVVQVERKRFLDEQSKMKADQAKMKEEHSSTLLEMKGEQAKMKEEHDKTLHETVVKMKDEQAKAKQEQDKILQETVDKMKAEQASALDNMKKKYEATPLASAEREKKKRDLHTAATATAVIPIIGPFVALGLETARSHMESEDAEAFERARRGN